MSFSDPEVPMVGSQAVLLVTVASAFAFGMVMALLGSIKLQLAERLGTDERRVDGLWGALHLGLIPLMLLSGYLLDQWGVRAVLMLGSTTTTLALLGVLWGTNYRATLLATLFAGAGAACLCVTSVVLMPYAFFGPAEPSASLNLGFVFFALGALVTPALAEVFLRMFGFRHTLSLLSLTCLVPAFLAVLVPEEHIVSAETGTLNSGVFLSPIVLFGGLVFFFYAPLESALGSWGRVYLAKAGYEESTIGRQLWGFWVAFLAGRLSAAYLQHIKILPGAFDPWTIMIAALLATVLIGNMAGVAYRHGTVWGLWILGFLLGPLFPTLIGLVFTHSLTDQGLSFGAVFAIGSMGGLLLTPGVKSRFEKVSPKETSYAPLFLSLGLACAALLFGLSLTI